MKERATFPVPFAALSNFSYASSALRVGMLPGGGYFGFFYEDGARFAVSHDGREIWADWPDGYAIEDACTYLMGPVLGFVLRLRGVTCLHASAVAINDRAIALVGSSEAGKSTTAAAFAKCGYAVISDDVIALDCRGDQFLVQPGYPRLNLWPDSVRALFGSPDALPRITPTWDKRYLNLDRDGFRFETRLLPLSAVYLLDRRELGDLFCPIEQVAPSPAMMTLLANTYVNYLLDAEMRRRDFNVLSRLLTAVPVRSVRAPDDSSRLCALCETIARNADGILAAPPPAIVLGHS